VAHTANRLKRIQKASYTLLVLTKSFGKSDNPLVHCNLVMFAESLEAFLFMLSVVPHFL